MAKVRVNFSASRPDVERRTEEECKAIRLLYGICITIRTEMGQIPTRIGLFEECR